MNRLKILSKKNKKIRVYKSEIKKLGLDPKNMDEKEIKEGADGANELAISSGISYRTAVKAIVDTLHRFKEFERDIARIDEEIRQERNRR